MPNDEKRNLVLKTSDIEANIPPEVIEKISNFLDIVFGKSLKSIGRMMSNELEIIEWQRSLRLNKKVIEIMENSDNKERFELPKPNFAKALIEQAIMEDVDELQDIWARLLVSAMDVNTKDSVRVAFVDILKQLEIIDIKILNYCFDGYIQSLSQSKAFYESIKNKDYPAPPAERASFRGELIVKKLQISKNEYKISIDNLMRSRLLQGAYSQTEKKLPSTSRSGRAIEDVIKIPQVHVYDKICLTELGINFIRCCTGCDDVFTAAGIQRP